MLIRPYKVSDVRDYFIGMKNTGLNHTTDKTGVKCIELTALEFATKMKEQEVSNGVRKEDLKGLLKVISLLE